MIGSRRVNGLCLAGLLASTSLARAADVPRTAPPATTVDVEEPHLYKPATTGAIAATGGALAIVGGAVFIESFRKYDVERTGGDGSSCRPCSASQLASVRAEFGSGIALIAVGGVLVLAGGIMAGLDHRYRREHAETKTARVTLDVGGLHF